MPEKPSVPRSWRRPSTSPARWSHAEGLDVDGACSASRPAGSPQVAHGSTTRTATSGGGGPPNRTAGDARLHRHRQMSMQFLREQLDDPQAQTVWSLRQLHAVDRRLRYRCWLCEAARAELRGQESPSNRRRIGRATWRRSASTCAPHLRAGDAEPGRAIARLAGVGYGPRLRELVGPNATDGDVRRTFSMPQSTCSLNGGTTGRNGRPLSWPWDRTASTASSSRPLRASPTPVIFPTGIHSAPGSLLKWWLQQRPPTQSSVDAYTWSPASTLVSEKWRTEAVLLVDDFVDSGWTMTVLVKSFVALERVVSIRWLYVVPLTVPASADYASQQLRPACPEASCPVLRPRPQPPTTARNY